MLIDFFYKGGPLMYPLLLGSVLMIAVVIERGYRFIRAGTKRRFMETVKEHVGGGRFSEAEELAASTPGPVAAVAHEALTMRRYTEDVIENAISLRGDRELSRLNRNLHLLDLIGKIAPMIGLLGTVLGMAGAFHQVASTTSVNPTMLASGIWEALITTVAGLFVGIPALVFHHLYLNKVRAIAFSMKHFGEEIVSMTRGRDD